MTTGIDDLPENYNGEEEKPALRVVEHSREVALKEESIFSDGMPYERGRVVLMGKFHLQHALTNFFEFGRCLMFMKENEAWSTLSDILEGEFGMSERTARKYMRFALFAKKYPRFKELFNQPGKMKQGLALVEGVIDPDNDPLLLQLEETGTIGDNSPGDLLEKPAKKWKEEAKRLRREKDLILAGATKELKDENEKLRAEIEGLEAVAVQVKGLRDQRRLIGSIDKLLIKAREMAGRINWAEIRQDSGLQQVALAMMDAAVRLGGYIETEVFYRDDES